ncbi:MAG: ABC transporter ATP-binding protein [Bythopirellula sp.]
MLQLRDVSKRYTVGGDSIVGLERVSLELNPGDFACLRGASGSGKTTLLLTAGGMQRPTTGSVDVAETENIYALGEADRARIRAQHIGFIFQLFHLVPYLNVFDNIKLGAQDRPDLNDEVEASIAKLRLQHRHNHKPAQLSVGECQRVAVGRALLSEPKVILADEPTGNLDEENANIVTTALQEFCRDGGVVLLATHSDRELESVNRMFNMRDGALVERQDAPLS